MSNRSNPFSLPSGITMPKKYNRFWAKQAWFIEGVHDAIRGRPMLQWRDAEKHADAGGWDAYWLGYQEGQKYLALHKKKE